MWKGDRRSLKIFGAKDSDSTSSLRCYFFFPFSVPLVLNLPSLEITFRQTQSRQPIHFRHGRYFTTQTGLYQLPLPDSSIAHVSVVYHCSHGSTFICSARVEGPCHHDWVRPVPPYSDIFHHGKTYVGSRQRPSSHAGLPLHIDSMSTAS